MFYQNTTFVTMNEWEEQDPRNIFKFSRASGESDLLTNNKVPCLSSMSSTHAKKKSSTSTSTLYYVYQYAIKYMHMA